MTLALLSVSHLSKSYPGLPVLHDVSFDVDAGEIVCLLGPSGCGKTTLLRIVAGLEAADRGTVTFASLDLGRIPVHRRQFGLMFQDFALFPHKNVFDNVAFGLRMQQLPSAQIARRVSGVLALVQLAGYERRRVTELSGGEQQRVALARSLAPGPRLLMLDEPLGSLDRTLREQVMNELRTILKRVNVTALYVTHDQAEAFAVADRVFVMRPDPAQGGRIEQAGTPQEVYRQPASSFVARFLGFRNLLPGMVVEQRTAPAARSSSQAETTAGRQVGAGGERPAGPEPALLLSPAGPASNLGRGAAGDSGPGPNVADSAFGPPVPSATCVVETALGLLHVGVGTQALCQPGAAVTALVRPEAAHVLPADAAAGPNIVVGTLEDGSFRGSAYLLRTRHAVDVELTCEVPATGQPLPAPGTPIALWLDPAAITLLPGGPH